VVRVLPGRYTARVNNAYKIQTLQILTQVFGDALGEMDVWSAGVTGHSVLKPTLDKIKTRILDNFLGMNGLVERAFTYPTAFEDRPSTHVTAAGGPTVTGLIGLKKAVFPLSEVLLWANKKVGNPDTYNVETFEMSDARIHGFGSLGIAENHCIKRWAGTARTAIVDVPSELTIAIPPFNSNAYFYKDDKGVETPIEGATNRIDLLFIYSKPVDVTSIYVGKYVNGSPTQITKAELGLVHGAGIGMNFEAGQTEKTYEPESAIDADGKTRILANAADQLMTDSGFTQLNVHGSFPAPDDLMNVAPVISENLEEDSPLLVGQSILPIAYIITTNTDSINASGVNIISDTSIIDIRPFLRTTELAYNERAGIAAAMPQLSLANPAVGKAQLDWEIRKAMQDYDAKIGAISKGGAEGGGTSPTSPRTVATGYIFGGALYGVEAALIDYLKVKNRGSTTPQAKAELVNSTSLPSTTILPDFPQWDLSKWVQVGNFASKGDFPNDYINTHIQRGSLNPADFGCFTDQARSNVATAFGTDNILGSKGQVCIHYVSKTVPFSKTGVTWMGDYNVDVELWNCVALASRARTGDNLAAAGSVGTWVDKREDQFTIYVAWVANDYMQDGAETGLLAGDTKYNSGSDFKTPHNNREGDHFIGFAVVNEDIIRQTNNTQAYDGEPQAGVAIYPTVTFTVTGIPKTFSGHYLGVGRDQTINLL
jgi:hypothetical protein